MTEQNSSDARALHGEAPTSLSWQDVTFSLGDKEILRKVTGLLEPGRLTAVMGPSGSGKTTLLNILSGRQRTSGTDRSQGQGQKVKFEGRVLLSGEERRPTSFRHRVAYVYQDSALHPCATPRECLDFSAYLRLPASMSSKDRQAYMEKMLKSLNLEACADTIVGDELQKGLSGGQKTRTAVGVELISNPKMLFLDEPLSGLDSYNAKELLGSLKDLAKSGVPVLLTMHQPSSDLFAQLDDLVVLHGGELVFHGPAKQLAGHFRNLGFDIPPNHNPADDVMFIIQQEEDDVVRSIKDRWVQSENCRALRAHAEQLADHAASQRDAAGPRSSSSESSGEEEEAAIVAAAERDEPRHGCVAQVGALVKREARHLRRQFALFFSQLFVFKLVPALIYGIFFLHAGTRADDPDSGPNCDHTHYGQAECWLAFTTHFSAMSAVSFTIVIESVGLPTVLFFAERSSFLREAAGGYYHVLPYYLCKVAVEGFLLGVECLALTLGSYWLIGFRCSFLEFMAGMWVLGMTSASMMWVVIAGCKTREQASALGMVPWILQFIFSGIPIPTAQVPSFIRWVRFIIPLHYGLGFLADIEFSYLFTDSGPSNTQMLGSNVSGVFPADDGLSFRQDVLRSTFDIEANSLWWPYLGMSCVLFFAYRTLAVLLLWRNSRFLA